MGCCLVAALVLSIGRRGWYALTRRPLPAQPFPPAARRPAPGGAGAPTPASPAPVPARVLVTVPVAVATTVLALAAVSGGLALAGLDASSDPAVPPLAADLVLATVLAGALALAPRWTTRPDESARALTAAGAAWTTLLLVEMHAFGTLTPSSTAVDVALHGAGLAALYLGLARWRPLAARTPSGALS